jgi:hypothetical protein
MARCRLSVPITRPLVRAAEELLGHPVSPFGAADALHAHLRREIDRLTVLGQWLRRVDAGPPRADTFAQTRRGR